jgi:hypothetical protein
MPPDFEQEVMKYINYWQSSGRFARDIRLAKEKNYTQKISQALQQHGLPAQFFYLAMQESDFDAYANGPMTRKGIAKGMWQFIPETGVKYGLHLGPLVDLGRPDPADEREQVDKATDAATRYIAMLYGTDAQASGLLVMACYNWGEDQVLPLVRSMPANPRERNFWKLLADHRKEIPQQTYDYVFYIISAAVIGENPRLFGFDFDNPLEMSAPSTGSRFSQLSPVSIDRNVAAGTAVRAEASETYLAPYGSESGRLISSAVALNASPSAIAKLNVRDAGLLEFSIAIMTANVDPMRILPNSLHRGFRVRQYRIQSEQISQLPGPLLRPFGISHEKLTVAGGGCFARSVHQPYLAIMTTPQN